MLGLDLQTFTLLHVAISLIGLAAGFVVIGGFLANTALPRATDVFLLTTIATNVTGFMFPFVAFLPSHAVALVSLVVLAAAAYAYYAKDLAGGWRTVFVATATAALYLNAFVLVVQTFQKNPALLALAPTQSEPAFVTAQALTLAAFALVGLLSWRRFHDTR
jgi:hypothetical protein